MIETLVILILLIVYSYFGYALILLILAKFRRKEGKLSESKVPPSVTLLISAYNEEVCIAEKIKNSLLLGYPNLEILVVSDASTDKTNEIVKSFPKVKLLELKTRKGKNNGLNEAIKNISSEIIVFSDANCLYQKNAINELVKHFQNPEIGCVIGELKFTNEKNSSVSESEGLYWKYEYFIKKLESDLGRLLVANGSIFSVRRELYPFLFADVANDFQIPLTVLSKGFKCVLEKNAIAKEKTASKPSDEFNRKVRIINRGLTGTFRLWKDLNFLSKIQLVSHKILRWFSGYFLFFIAIFSFFLRNENKSLFFFCCLQVTFYLVASIGFFMDKSKKKLSITYVPFYFCLINFAGMKAVSEFFSGKKYSTWTPPKSAR